MDSIYIEDNTKRHRSFDFQLAESNQIAELEPRATCPAGVGTQVLMRDFTLSFMNKAPADPETFLQRLAQHFLNVVVAENPIAIEVTDGSLRSNLATYLLDHVRANDLDTIPLQPELLFEAVDLITRHLRISKKFRAAKGCNRLLMFGNDRSANERNIDGAIGLGMLDNEEVYIGCISSSYLDRQVDSERWGLTVSEDELVVKI